MFTYAKRGTQGWSDVVARTEWFSPARSSRNISSVRRHCMPTSRTEPVRGHRFAPQAYAQSRATQSEPALSLSRPSDASEREADALAERVLSSPSAPGWAAPVSSANHAPVQRRCGDMGEEEARGGEGESPEAEMPGRGEAPPESSRGIAAAVEGLGVGEPLAPGPRQFFERRFGYEFSGVRVHADGKAAQAARALSAKAFTIRFLYTELKPNQTFVVAFRSNEGYRIYKVFRGIQRTVVGAEVFVQMPNGTRLTIEQLRARRAAAGAASAPAPGAP